MEEQGKRRVGGKSEGEGSRRGLDGDGHLIERRGEVTNLIVGTGLRANHQGAAGLIQDGHLGVGEGGGEAIVGTRGNIEVDEEGGFGLQVFEFNILGLAEHGDGRLAGRSGPQGGGHDLKFKTENGDTRRRGIANADADIGGGGIRGWRTLHGHLAAAAQPGMPPSPGIAVPRMEVPIIAL
jgi:hypothetical protein